MLADVLATAAFVLGPEEGITLLEGQGVEGLIVTAELRQHRTKGWSSEA
jgi:thiamine biosynthesis lipoprotein